jgi:DNA-binding GntR family transcriptional regulator
MPRLRILFQQHVDIVDALENRDVMKCTHLIQSHADIDFEAQSLLSSSLKEALHKSKEREKRSDHENN